VYDDQPNAHKKFMEKLDACIRNHDKEIEKMCNFHHQGFVDAITELLKVRADAEKLKVGSLRRLLALILIKLYNTTVHGALGALSERR
jgi:ferric iron reductase protein FhuF